jgi:ribosomal protein S12 methylthiotransferase accessory factor YcaO
MKKTKPTRPAKTNNLEYGPGFSSMTNSTPAFPAPADTPALTYELRLMTTHDATGYFMPVPAGEPDFQTTLAYLQDHPNDEFMHRWGLQRVLQMPPEQIRAMLSSDARDPVLNALLLEAIVTHEPLAALKQQVGEEMMTALRTASPLLILRSEVLPDQDLHRQWIALLKENLLRHQPVPAPSETGLAPLFEDEPAVERIPLPAIAPPSTPQSEASPPPDFAAVYTHALDALQHAGIRLEQEMRHESSLSPIALLRRWQMEIRVEQDRHHFLFSGGQTAYGKGLSLERARASYAMEIVERCSSFATVVNGMLPETARQLHLRHAPLSELQREGLSVLDPNTMVLEVPYRDQPLYWIEGVQGGAEEEGVVLVPFQAVFLFANLDEVNLFSGLGSTGLAAGWSLAQARFHALLECIERDAEAVQCYDPRQCFRLATRDAMVGGLLADYRRRGIDVFFQDCSTEFGIPCYKCFVVGADGTIAKGTSAHFAGWQAALAALTETPYPYPHGPASGPAPVDLPMRYLEELPDYTSGHVESDLQRLEALLAANHFQPLYVDLTRQDVGIPVVRALVPGLELVSDFDRYSRVSLRLYQNYRQGFDCSGVPCEYSD